MFQPAETWPTVPEGRVQCRSHGGCADDGAKRDGEAAQVGNGKQSRCDTGHAGGEADSEEDGTQLGTASTPVSLAAAAGAPPTECPQANDHQHAGNVEPQHLHGKIARCPWDRAARPPHRAGPQPATAARKRARPGTGQDPRRWRPPPWWPWWCPWPVAKPCRPRTGSGKENGQGRQHHQAGAESDHPHQERAYSTSKRQGDPGHGASLRPGGQGPQPNCFFLYFIYLQRFNWARATLLC